MCFSYTPEYIVNPCAWCQLCHLGFSTLSQGRSTILAWSPTVKEFSCWGAGYTIYGLAIKSRSQCVPPSYFTYLKSFIIAMSNVLVFTPLSRKSPRDLMVILWSLPLTTQFVKLILECHILTRDGGYYGLNVSLTNSYGGVLTPRTSKCGCIWR